MDEGVRTTSAWQDLNDARLADIRTVISPLIDDFDHRAAPSEANTERDLIDKMLTLLGWEFSVQEKANQKGRSDVPDYLLFLDAAAKSVATRSTKVTERYAQGATIVEAKAWDIALDKSEPGHAGAPSTQVLRYLGTVDVQSNGGIRFGILTNGRLWRLYDHKHRSRLEGYVEIDLTKAMTDDEQLRLFLIFFARAAFVPTLTGKTPLTRALEDSRSFEARVTDALADKVFGSVFPALAGALAANDPQRPAVPDTAYFGQLREAALTWLYRLLFVLYAEDRDLLPTRQRRDGLREMRKEVAFAIDNREGLSEHPENDRDLRSLWHKIDVGDRGIGLPPYNGGLFKDGRSPLLDRSLIPDVDFAPLLDALSRETTGDAPRLINYRDLSVQHLGSVYERLLEFDLAELDGRIVARPQTFARKTSGSYYTPEELVMLVIRRTIGPLLDEKRAIFANVVGEKARTKQAKDNPEFPLAAVAGYDPATAFLTLRICDPAMGSGHFLVSLVDYLADQVMLATTDAAALVGFGDYRSPLLDRLESIRARIREQADANGWRVEDAQLIDRQLVRRIILKRVVHGVDKNPMAVELAKLSLWLHTFTVGAPLSFLDHHLRCGDSLFGEWVASGMDRLERGGLFKGDELSAAERAITEMQQVEEITDADIGEVHESARNFDAARAKIAPLERYFSLLQGYRWLEGTADDARKKARAVEKEAARTNDTDEAMRLTRLAWDLKRKGSALDALLDGDLGEPDAVLDMCYGRIGTTRVPGADEDAALGPLIKAVGIAADANFLHWELAFPTVWQHWRSPSQRRGGFDAIIGNPPWDRMKMQEVEWFASRRPDIARATRAADRTRMVAALKSNGDPLADQYDRASEMAALASRMANLRDGQYPLLGRGDTNLYSLFVEAAQRLVNPGGIVGLLVPSGIAGDLGASAFFRSISTTGRLGALLDYANRPAPGLPEFFTDVDSRFKFCALVFGGAQRTFAAAQCGFFLGTTNDTALADATFPLAPADFAAVNPNTGTAPVFRTVRDADLTTAIYARLPVLVKHQQAEEKSAAPDPRAVVGDLLGGPAQKKASVSLWPVRYLRMFDMTNDSHLFRSRAELEADGWYPVAGGRMNKGTAEAVPLYEGKMVQAFDHRAASVTVNADNLHRPGQPESATPEQHADPDWLPDPQFWVDAANVSEGGVERWCIGFKDVTAPTNMRTMIASMVPFAGYGNTLPVLLLPDPVDSALVLANLNAFALDYVVRQKVQGQHVNWYIVEQLPVIPPAAYDSNFGAMSARQIVAREVLHLTYTAHDMAPFARDMGYVDGDGAVLPPFVWDDADRRQRRARLDALYFHLYGLSKADAEYILSTFPIIERHDMRDHGRYLTRDLILAQMDALAAGDADAAIVVR
ncbi:Eco57I restriction-modification methylase domain-containing protein [Sphingomonas sp. SUN039]|uniref:Eco57I restriction-modification methylase domain-containing protein n=1 Tax=Sphingomonas sp. SUN039 TaxID=2937787 RepID=UPI00216412B0|nr:hypothetical protein [Sphingomonas sp. SUN039]UVO54403.1 hypothetical protein M0209_09820 [Sphingomonas sp. SUN039]